MVNPVLRDLLEFTKYRKILNDACYHYTKRLENLPKLDKFKDSIPHSLETWISDDPLHDDLKEFEDLEDKDSSELINKIGNNDVLIQYLKDAICVYYKDYQDTKNAVKNELGLIPHIYIDDYEKNLKEVYDKINDAVKKLLEF